MKNEHWMIYALRDPQDWKWAVPEVVYIGKSDDPYRRVKEHAVEALDVLLRWEEEADRLGAYDTETNPPPVGFTWWLSGHWREARLPEVVILEHGSGDGWREREKFWIEAAGLLGIDLFNKTAGG